MENQLNFDKWSNQSTPHDTNFNQIHDKPCIMVISRALEGIWKINVAIFMY